MLRELLLALGPSVSDPQHPAGAGYLLHGGYIFQCAGEVGPNPRFDEDTAAGLNPEPEILIRHTIGTLKGGPDEHYPIPWYDPDNDGHTGSNPEVNDAVFELDPSQPPDFDPTKGVCGICGKPILLRG